MKTYPSEGQFLRSPVSLALLNCLRQDETECGLKEASLYLSFPIYRDEEGGALIADCLMVSAQYGVIAFALSNEGQLSEGEFSRCREIIEQVPSYIQSRLIKNRQLRKNPTRLAFDITPVIYSPFISELPHAIEGIKWASSDDALIGILRETNNPIDEGTFQELIATIEGAKGMIRPKLRSLATQDVSSKGKQIELMEAAITLFDQQQKLGIMGTISGPQRIRGLAGSGKTVVLSMMAALTHLRYPDAKIAYTFYTKSLYQHIKRLITRFYRQFDDRDPDWENGVHILHGWGGSSTPGIYWEACESQGVPALTYRQASAVATADKFDYACASLLSTTKINPIYDYIMIDEGQDFPVSFVRLCHQLSTDGKFVLAYDELQTIFQSTAPSEADIFGSEDGNPKASFEEDIVLHKCYRNPREIIVAAHALGFGIYSNRIIQILENREHWEDLGYTVIEGEFKQGSQMKIERPEGNSNTFLSKSGSFDDIVKAESYMAGKDEIAAVVKSIQADIKCGLLPEDILVVTVDDRNAKQYLSDIECSLNNKGISCNNLHTDTFGICDFSKEKRVTLATVHKAKGNEAFMVYVVGVDSVMYNSDARSRNMLFTAITRAKGWVSLSGVGPYAEQCKKELSQVKKNFTYRVFSYPGPKDLKVMKRDLAEAADRKLRKKRLHDQLEEYTHEEIEEVLKSKKQKGIDRDKFKVKGRVYDRRRGV
ncbi:MAG: ATP-binding domain-containing protein [Candidatus Sumerlaeota bacterium]|nr:ATP-binding domain-containing protein [Candidatus Sumerlaeota bacterium]